ncbi:RNA polymerase sigma factor [Nocardiopsis trehalosi]|uniref:RNA polymerase sigma factor n=1 Tax=Nocardiopsis trehalosi TaxID=109329 RepID=UPI000834D7F8|nr:sigma-70 family RNA polymerase sigma factor [Nocardiopsis trehalosi]
MTTHADTGRHHADSGAEVAALLRAGGGHGRCYDDFAPDLYRYCWTLTGPAGPEGEDPAADAVHQALLAAAHLVGDLADPAELRPWLFALARAAARRRGFATRSPYTALATAPAERPAADLWRRLPPSHRELLELHLRHGVAPAHTAKILGLAPGTAAELCRAAVARAAEAAAAAGPAEPPAERTEPERRVRARLAALEPPGPPAGLRARTVHDCASPLRVATRRAAAEDLLPLGADGFPLHRAEPEVAALLAAAPAAGEPPAGPGPEEVALPPQDRVTTADVAAPAAEQVAGPAPSGGGRTRRRLPLVAGSLAAAAVAAALGAALLLGGADAPDTVGPGPADRAVPPAAGGAASPVPDPAHTPHHGSPSAPAAAQGPAGAAATPAPSADGAPAHDAPPPPAAEDPGDATPSPPPAGGAPEAPREPDDPGAPGEQPTAPAPPGDGGDGEDRRGPVGRLLEGLVGLLTPGD